MRAYGMRRGEIVCACCTAWLKHKSFKAHARQQGRNAIAQELDRLENANHSNNVDGRGGPDPKAPMHLQAASLSLRENINLFGTYSDETEG